MEVETVLPFAPRGWQVPLINDPAKRIVAVVHRRAGKSTGLMWRGLKRALTIPRQNPPPRIIHTLPFQVQWDRTGLWDRLAHAAKGIPGARPLKSDMRLLLPNGAVYQAGGMDRPDSWRGGYADEVILDEYDDTQAEGQSTAIEPMLADFGGVLLRSGTPKGFGRLKGAYDRAKADPEYSTYLLTYRDTGVLGDEAIAALRKEMTEEEFAQEMECSFEAPNSGAYYAKLMQAAESQGRIGSVPYDPALPVWTAWDLGMDDAMAIWFAQLAPGGEARIIGYYENSGMGLEHYTAEIGRRGYSNFAGHILPHDAEVRELTAGGRTRVEFLHGLGLKQTVVLSGGPGSVSDGVSAARMMLPRCRFDANACAQGIKSLWHYHRDWNDDLKVFRANAVHDWSSHAADAFRYLAVGMREKAAAPVLKMPPIPPQSFSQNAWMS